MQAAFTLAYADSAGVRAMQEFELNAARGTWGEKHPNTALAKSNLGITLHTLGCIPLARELLECALKDCRRVWGKKHLNTVWAMHNLALTLNDEGDAPRALVLLTNVVKLLRRKMGEEHPDTVDATESLAFTLYRLGSYQAAQTLQVQVLTLRQRDLGANHPATIEAIGSLGSTINNMAVALRNDGNLEKAEHLQFEALAMVVKAYGANSLQAACIYSAAGALLRLKGEVEQAIAYFNQAIEIREQVLGTHAELTLLVRARLRETLH
jgi:tetratricopeptide (TPR) repeat protein